MIQIKTHKPITNQVIRGLLWVAALLMFLISAVIFIIWLVGLFGLTHQMQPGVSPVGGLLWSTPPLWRQTIVWLIEAFLVVSDVLISFFAFRYLLRANRKNFLFIFLGLLVIIILFFALHVVAVFGTVEVYHFQSLSGLIHKIIQR